MRQNFSWLLRLLYKLLKALFGPLRLEEMAIFRPLQHQLLKLARQEMIEVNGYRLFLDEADSLKLSMNGSYEIFETELIKRLVQPADRVVDIGANIGYYSLLMSGLVGSKGKVYAFEPDPTNLDLLRRNIDFNNRENIVVVPEAVANRQGFSQFYVSDNNRGAHSLEATEALTAAGEVAITSLDHYFKSNRSNISLIKMDIQGAEYKALVGMKQVLVQNPQLILITEYWPYGLEKSGVAPKDYLRAIESLGFQIYEIHENTRRIKQLDKTSLHKNLVGKNRFTNLMAARSENKKFLTFLSEVNR